MSGPICSICSRSDAGGINAALLEGRSARSVALEMDLSVDSVQRHAQKQHFKRIPVIPRAKDAKTPKPETDPLDELVSALRDKALSNTNDAAIVHQYRLALQAQKDSKNGAPTERDLSTDAEWLAMATKIVAAVEPFPEARIAIAKALA